jgi:tryptophan-rich sensory protein
MDTYPLFMFLGFIAVCFLPALTGAVFRPGDWYERLAKPSWRPPNWLFAPVWTVLYFAIAVSGWLIWREASFAGAVPRSGQSCQRRRWRIWCPERPRSLRLGCCSSPSFATQAAIRVSSILSGPAGWPS